MGGPWGQAWGLSWRGHMHMGQQRLAAIPGRSFMFWATPAPRLQAYWGQLPPGDPSTGTFWNTPQFSGLLSNLVPHPHGMDPDPYPPLLSLSFILEGFPELGTRLPPNCILYLLTFWFQADWLRTTPLPQILAHLLL